jgi:hypothetical protein
MIAGGPNLDALMKRLAIERPIFHSEHDFHAFGQVLHASIRGFRSVSRFRRASVNISTFG